MFCPARLFVDPKLNNKVFFCRERFFICLIRSINDFLVVFLKTKNNQGCLLVDKVMD